MKIEAMRDWSAEERHAKEKEWRQALFTLRLQKATGQLDNPMKIRELKKDIARLKTAENMPVVTVERSVTSAGAQEAAAPSVQAPAQPPAETPPPAATKTKKAAPKKPATKSAAAKTPSAKKPAARPKASGKRAAKAKKK